MTGTGECVCAGPKSKPEMCKPFLCTLALGRPATLSAVEGLADGLADVPTLLLGFFVGAENNSTR